MERFYWLHTQRSVTKNHRIGITLNILLFFGSVFYELDHTENIRRIPESQAIQILTSTTYTEGF
jgi:hypothetical protein